MYVCVSAFSFDGQGGEANAWEQALVYIDGRGEFSVYKIWFSFLGVFAPHITSQHITSPSSIPGNPDLCGRGEGRGRAGGGRRPKAIRAYSFIFPIFFFVYLFSSRVFYPTLRQAVRIYLSIYLSVLSVPLHRKKFSRARFFG